MSVLNQISLGYENAACTNGMNCTGRMEKQAVLWMGLQNPSSYLVRITWHDLSPELYGYDYNYNGNSRYYSYSGLTLLLVIVK
jgi:hypothetical protein